MGLNNNLIKRFIIIIFIITIVIIFAIFFDIDISDITIKEAQEWILSFGSLSPIIYILSQIVRPITLLPATIFSIVGGLAFGPLWGTIYSVIGALICGLVEFFIARYLGRAFIEKFIKGNIANIDEKIKNHGFKIILLIRIIPNAPYDIQNLSLGLTKIRTSHYFLGTFLGIIPGTFAVVYLGYSITDFKRVWKIILTILILVSLFLVQKYLRRKKINYT